MNPGNTHRACQANRCHQGRHTCPCPQACEIPDEDPASPLEWIVVVVMVAAFVVLVFSALFLAPGA